MIRQYSVVEIDQMRESVNTLMSSPNTSYNPVERSAEVENRLRTHMQNGTDPSALLKAAGHHIEKERDAQRRLLELRAEMQASRPPPRVLKTKDDVIGEWFETSIAQYSGASATAAELYDGFSGYTLKRFANQHAPDGINVTQRDMERYLDAKGIKTRHAMFAKRYDGVQVVIYGNVRSGNYGT